MISFDCAVRVTNTSTNLFEYFRTKFDFSIIISHVESMRDMVDNLIEVNKIKNFSQIQHT